MKELKYLFAYTVPISVYISFISTGLWTYSAIFYVFLLIPLLDFLFGETEKNLSNNDASYQNKKWIFDIMLYFNVPIIFGLLYVIFSLFQVNNYKLQESCCKEKKMRHLISFQCPTLAFPIAQVVRSAKLCRYNAIARSF